MLADAVRQVAEPFPGRMVWPLEGGGGGGGGGGDESERH